MTKKTSEMEPVIITPVPDSKQLPYTVDEAQALYVALYLEWRDADIMLERLGYSLEVDGELIPLSKRIEDAIQDAEETAS